MTRWTAPTNLHIRPARVEDAEGIVRVIHSGFEPAELSLMIYGCHGIERFIALQVEQAAIGRSSYYTVVADDVGRVVGCTEVRRIPDGIYWNYLSVDPDHRAGGLGRALIRTALEEHPDTSGTLRLEVLERNVSAISWYERLGFEQVGTTESWSMPIADHPAAPEAQVSGLPQAEICHEALGFSQITVTTAVGVYQVGRIGDDWFRITDGAALTDIGLAAALARLGERRVLAVIDAGAVPADLTGRGELIHRTFRMTVPLDTVRVALGS